MILICCSLCIYNNGETLSLLYSAILNYIVQPFIIYNVKPYFFSKALATNHVCIASVVSRP